MQRFVMQPSTGDAVLRFVGDSLAFSLRASDGESLPANWRAMLRTNLGGAQTLREEISHAHTSRFGLVDASWRDLPMTLTEGEWRRELVLCEPGYFRAKAYALDDQGRQHWPEGADVGISIHPD